MNRFLIPQLAWGDYTATVVLCGDTEDFEGIRDVLDPRVNFFVNKPNVLGDKKNTILNIARDLGSEYLAWIDSDDLFSPQTLLELVNKADENKHWSAIREFAFLESRSGDMVAYEGYPTNHQLRAYGMGSGRIFTRHALSLLPDSVFPSRNKSMDDGVRGVLDAIKIPEDLRMVGGLAQWPLGVKSGTNLWDFNHYKGDSIGFSDTRVSWVPLEIRRLLSTLRDQPPGAQRRS
jgi:glycosyltransferase involved in cell wall biosynthesis